MLAFCAPHAGRHRGAGLLDAIVALTLLAFGVLGLALVLTRLQADARTTLARGTAIGLIADMGERMHVNRGAALQGAYALHWGQHTVATACDTQACNAQAWAQTDLYQWLSDVRTQLPGGDAAIFVSDWDSTHFGIAIAWHANEASQADTDPATYKAPFGIDARLPQRNGLACPVHAVCHLAYVTP